MTTEIRCEFGCECDTIVDFQPTDAILGPKDYERLVVEKIDRARRYINQRELIKDQYESI